MGGHLLSGRRLCLGTLEQGALCFNPFLWDGEDLVPVAAEVFEAHDLVRLFNIPDKVLQTFLAKVKGHYPPNPYHNW